MSYKVYANADGGFDVFESKSDTVIELSTTETKARNICRKLNLGAGFNGWTPGFVAVQYPLTIAEE